jgi:hypothetical protein
MPERNSTLEPLLAPALELDELPVLADRQDMQLEASNLVQSLERIAAKAQRERDPNAAGQLMNVAESLGVMVISLVAYTRGRVPRVKSKKPGTNIIVQ